VARQLQLGVTLKPTAGGGFELDLRTPDAHKTAAIFGPSTTAVPAAACALVRAWLAAAGLTTTAGAKPYVFVLGGGRRGGGAVDHSKALDARRWTEVVQAVLKRQAGVAFAPKDLRSSFITFLLSETPTRTRRSRRPWRRPCATRRRCRARRRTTRSAHRARGPRPCRWRARSPRALSEART